jgi:type I restriction enzyme M protein
VKLKDRVLRIAGIGAFTYFMLLVFTVVYLSTPRRLARLIGELCRPQPGMSCYDPCCGSGRLPRAVDAAARRSGAGRIRISAQEIDPISFLAAALNRTLHGLHMTLRPGSSIRHPAFVDPNGGLQRFDLAVASPPWNRTIPDVIRDSDRFGRFPFGWPRDGDWTWTQHVLAHLDVGGRMVVMLDRPAVSRDEDPVEVAVRQRFVESELIEAVVLCPWEIAWPRVLARSGLIQMQEAVLVVVNRAKPRPGEILFVDTQPLVAGYLAGDLTADAVRETVIDALVNWTAVPGVAEVVSHAGVASSGFSLAPELHCAGRTVTTTARPGETSGVAERSS